MMKPTVSLEHVASLFSLLISLPSFFFLPLSFDAGDHSDLVTWHEMRLSAAEKTKYIARSGSQ